MTGEVVRRDMSGRGRSRGIVLVVIYPRKNRYIQGFRFIIQLFNQTASLPDLVRDEHILLLYTFGG